MTTRDIPGVIELTCNGCGTVALDPPLMGGTGEEIPGDYWMECSPIGNRIVTNRKHLCPKCWKKIATA